MPNPVSSTNSSYYDPNAQYTPVDGATPGRAASIGTAPAAAPEISIPPIVIAADAGAQQLVKQHGAALPRPDCSHEGASAALSCGKAGLVAATGILVSSTTVIGTGLAVAATFAESVACGKDLRAYYECKTQ